MNAFSDGAWSGRRRVHRKGWAILLLGLLGLGGIFSVWCGAQLVPAPSVVAAKPAQEAMQAPALLSTDGEGRNALVDRAIDALDAGRTDEAVMKLRRFLADDTQTLTAFSVLGWAAWKQNQTEQAVALWKLMRKVTAGLPLAENVLAKGFIPGNEVAGFAEYYNRTFVAGQAPEKAQEQIAAGLAKRSQEDLVRQGNMGAGLVAAVQELQNGKMDVAAGRVRQFLASDPVVLRAFGALGWAYWRVNMKDDAVFLWQELRNLTQGNGIEHQVLMAGYLPVGHTDAAVDYYSRSLAMDAEEVRNALFRTPVAVDTSTVQVTSSTTASHGLTLDPSRATVDIAAVIPDPGAQTVSRPVPESLNRDAAEELREYIRSRKSVQSRGSEPLAAKIEKEPVLKPVYLNPLPATIGTAFARSGSPLPPPPASDEGAALRSSSLAPPPAASDKVWEAALADLQAGRYERAAPKLRLVVEKEPASLRAWSALGWAYWMLGRKEDAMAVWQDVRQLGLQDEIGIGDLRRCYLPPDEYLDQAVDYYAWCLNANVDDVRRRLGRQPAVKPLAYQASSLPARLKTLVDENPDRIELRVAYAQALGKDGRIEEALEQWQVIRRQDSRSADYAAQEQEIRERLDARSRSTVETWRAGEGETLVADATLKPPIRVDSWSASDADLRPTTRTRASYRVNADTEDTLTPRPTLIKKREGGYFASNQEPYDGNWDYYRRKYVPEEEIPALSDALADLEANRFDEGASRLERLVVRYPSRLKVRSALGWAYWNTGRKEDAMALWEDYRQSGSARRLDYSDLREGYIPKSDTDKAALYYSRCWALDAEEVRRRIVPAARSELVIPQTKADSSSQVARLRALLEQSPGDLELRADLARALMAAGLYDDALEQWNYVRKMDPDNSDYVTYQTEALRHAGARGAQPPERAKDPPRRATAPLPAAAYASPVAPAAKPATALPSPYAANKQPELRGYYKQYGEYSPYYIPAPPPQSNAAPPPQPPVYRRQYYEYNPYAPDRRVETDNRRQAPLPTAPAPAYRSDYSPYSPYGVYSQEPRAPVPDPRSSQPVYRGDYTQPSPYNSGVRSDPVYRREALPPVDTRPPASGTIYEPYNDRRTETESYPQSPLPTAPRAPASQGYYLQYNDYSSYEEPPPRAPTGPAPSRLAGAPLPAKTATEGGERKTKTENLLSQALDDLDVGEVDDAIPKLETVLEEEPLKLKGWTALGYAYWKQGRRDEAAALFRKLRMVAPDMRLDSSVLTTGYINRGNMEEAIQFYSECLGLDAEQLRTQYSRRQMQRLAGAEGLTLPRLRQMVVENPGWVDIRIELAKKLMGQKAYAEALEQWDAIRQVHPDSVLYMENQAECLLYTDRPKETIDLCQMILERDNGNLKALKLWTDATEFGKTPEDAFVPLQHMIAGAPGRKERLAAKHRAAALHIALWHRDPKRWGLGAPISLLTEVFDEDPSDTNAILTRGELYMAQKKFKEAEGDFSHVLAHLNPNSVRARNGLFQILADTKQYDEAAKQFDLRAAFNPDNPYLLYERAKFEAQRGDYAKAEKLLDQLEAAGNRGAVGLLLYHGLSEEEYGDALPLERFREQLAALRQAGFSFVPPADVPRILSATGDPLTKGTAGGVPAAGKLQKLVSVTFDDARRDALTLGSPVAAEYGTRFGMMVPIGPILDKISFTGDWDMLRYFAPSWDYGSHMIYASYAEALDNLGTMGRPLPNRIWRPDANRLETRNEYLTRIRAEHEGTRRMLQENLGDLQTGVMMVAYPFGDIGQETGSNVTDAILVNLREASRNYSMGFIQSRYGFAVSGDNPLLYQRWEPKRGVTGADLVRRMLENHPVILARRSKVELATDMGKPYKAEGLIRQLEEDGLPPESLDITREYLRTRLARYFVDSGRTKDQPVPPRVVGLINPYVQASAAYTRNSLSETDWHVNALGGGRLTPGWTVEGRAGMGEYRSDDLSDDLGNVLYPKLSIEETSYGARLKYAFPSGNYLAGDLLQREFGRPANSSVMAYGFEAAYAPSLPLEFFGRYEHDAVPSARAISDGVTYDSTSLQANYRITDRWDMAGGVTYASFSDDNTRTNLTVRSPYLLRENLGLYVGPRYDFVSAGERRDSYWTPKQLHRIGGEALIKKKYGKLYCELGGTLGLGMDQSWTDGEDASFSPSFGFKASIRAPLSERWSVFGALSYTNAPSYNELGLMSGLRLQF